MLPSALLNAVAERLTTEDSVRADLVLPSRLLDGSSGQHKAFTLALAGVGDTGRPRGETLQAGDLVVSVLWRVKPKAARASYDDLWDHLYTISQRLMQRGWAKDFALVAVTSRDVVESPSGEQLEGRLRLKIQFIYTYEE